MLTKFTGGKIVTDGKLAARNKIDIGLLEVIEHRLWFAAVCIVYSRRGVPVGVPLDLKWSGASYRSITEYRLAS